MATPGFLEEYAKDFATQAKGAYSVPIDTSQFTGRQFVAGEDPLQTQAINLATQEILVVVEKVQCWVNTMLEL